MIGGDETGGRVVTAAEELGVVPEHGGGLRPAGLAPAAGAVHVDREADLQTTQMTSAHGELLPYKQLMGPRATSGAAQAAAGAPHQELHKQQQAQQQQWKGRMAEAEAEDEASHHIRLQPHCAANMGVPAGCGK